MSTRYLILQAPKKVNLRRLIRTDDEELTAPQRRMKKALLSMGAEVERMAGMGEFDNKNLWLLRVERGIQNFRDFIAEHAPAFKALRMHKIRKQLVTEIVDGVKVPVLVDGKKQYVTDYEHKTNEDDLIIQQHLIKRKDKDGNDVDRVPGEEVILAGHDNANERDNPPTLTIR